MKQENFKQFNIFTNEDNLTEKDAMQMNAVVLAFVGDAVHSLFTRNHFALTHSSSSGQLHLFTTKMVKASAQSQMLDFIFDRLTENEKAIALRARNTKTNNIAKNSNLAEYKKSTAFEAVIGFMFLTGHKERVNELLTDCFNYLEEKQTT